MHAAPSLFPPNHLLILFFPLSSGRTPTPKVLPPVFFYMTEQALGFSSLKICGAMGWWWCGGAYAAYDGGG